MSKFNYEWWVVDIRTPVGIYPCEFKGKDREHVIKQIEKEVRFTNSEKNLSAPFWSRRNQILEVYWDTLKLDRTGYQRLS